MSYLYEEQKQALLEIHEVLADNTFLQKCQIGFGTFLGAYAKKAKHQSKQLG